MKHNIYTSAVKLTARFTLRWGANQRQCTAILLGRAEGGSFVGVGDICRKILKIEVLENETSDVVIQRVLKTSQFVLI